MRMGRLISTVCLRPKPGSFVWCICSKVAAAGGGPPHSFKLHCKSRVFAVGAKSARAISFLPGRPRSLVANIVSVKLAHRFGSTQSLPRGCRSSPLHSRASHSQPCALPFNGGFHSFRPGSENPGALLSHADGLSHSPPPLNPVASVIFLFPFCPLFPCPLPLCVQEYSYPPPYPSSNLFRFPFFRSPRIEDHRPSFSLPRGREARVTAAGYSAARPPPYFSNPMVYPSLCRGTFQAFFSRRGKSGALFLLKTAIPRLHRSGLQDFSPTCSYHPPPPEFTPVCSAASP